MSTDDLNLTNLAKPSNDATITIRCIKNFEYRTCRNLVLQHVNLETNTVGDLKRIILENTLKVYTLAHGHKTMNLIINVEDDDKLILHDDEAVLAWQGIENETEISFFYGKDYEEFKKHPDVMKW
ncbi:hypothetical protein BDB01DRAFT_845373 [Pilobolus umbonatus]|nr:hypothetical protein BDB01DRAFT_845373 [Pilobolus umbonatus]